jgi:hypothetical protein
MRFHLFLLPALMFSGSFSYGSERASQKPTRDFEKDSLIRNKTTGAGTGDTSNFMRTLYSVNAYMEWYMKYFPVPFGSYSKETNLLVGLSKYNAFTLNKGDIHDSVTEPSSASLLAYYTLNKQYKFVFEANLMRNKNKALWKTDLINTHYPLLFFGTGNETDIDNAQTLNTSDFQFTTQYLFRTWRKWYIGPSVDYHYFYEVEMEESSPGNDVEPEDFSENLGLQSGLGIKISMEGRDNRLNAKHGFFIDAGFQVFDKFLGGDFNYKYVQADLRYYFTPLKKLTIATQARTESKQGNVPVQSLAFLGGDYTMRGIYLGRYRDKVSIDSQVELRFPIFWILGGTVFGGAGQVAPEYAQMSWDSFHYCYGTGLRLKVDSKHDINLRFDMGFSADQNIFIMNFSEAF